MLQKNIPILRIFDVSKAKEFYIDWLGFTIEWEHQFETVTPFYIGIKRDDIEIHLSEHHGDSTPGTKVFIICNQIEEYLVELKGKAYKYYRPGINETFYGCKEMVVQDPFGNKLSFNEYL